MGRRNVKTAVEGLTVRRTTVKKKVDADAISPLELQHKKSLAVFLRVATYTNAQIAEALGVTKGTVKSWFKEPDVVKLYEKTLESLSTAAKQFLETLTIEAVKTLGALLVDPDHKLRLDAAREILDRGGMPKLSRVERKDDRPPAIDRPGEVNLNLHVKSPEDADRIENLIREAERYTHEAS